MSLPDFLCIGAQKAGTSWLYSMLAQHPDVYLGPFKEYQYFNALYVPSHRRWARMHIVNSLLQRIRTEVNKATSVDVAYIERLVSLMNEKRIFTEGWYREIYDTPGARIMCRGDITPEYCTLPADGIKYVRELLGAVKIIYIIRDPVQRALSQLRMNISRHYKGKELSQQQWTDLVNDPEIIHRGNYSQYIPRWLEIFQDESLLFIPYQDLADNPNQTMKLVETHLGVRHHHYNQLDKRIHVTEKITIPEFVIDSLVEKHAHQNKFLEKQLGLDFVSRI